MFPTALTLPNGRRALATLCAAVLAVTVVEAQTCPPIAVANWTSSTTGTLGSVGFTVTGTTSPFTPPSFCDMAGSDFSAAPLSGTVIVLDYGQGSDWVATFATPVPELYVYMCVWRAASYTFDQPFTILSGAATATVSGTTISTTPTFTSGILRFTNITTLSVFEPTTTGSKQQLTFAAPAPCSSEVIRPGTPPNPIALLPGVTSGPIVGAVWDPVVDHSTFLPSAVVDLLAVGLPGADVPLVYGTLLINLFGPLFFYAAPAAGSPFQVPLPPDPALAGVGLSSQAASIDASSVVRFTNALDIVIG